MAGNRKLPFGYRMELGRVVVHSAEVDVVQYIFQQFIIDFYAFFLGFVAEIDAKDDRKIFIFNGLQREKVF